MRMPFRYIYANTGLISGKNWQNEVFFLVFIVLWQVFSVKVYLKIGFFPYYLLAELHNSLACTLLQAEAQLHDSL